MATAAFASEAPERLGNGHDLRLSGVVQATSVVEW